ncbi:histone deacetylase family protein [Methylophaga sp.]|uniref:histone deacetylase family protein n=1 Tax=Methylophaga sp. TaxID=2024840 RepID=UPI0013FFB3DF|nr:histone deacetylase family protein [Methylophaga sp.]MTI63623.1 histone deacetylase family protein [Methylophaga sp.]
MTLALISHPDCSLHQTVSYHPETAERLTAIHDQLLASGLEMILHQYQAPLVTREQLQRVHDSNYLDDIFHKLDDQEQAWLDADTLMMQGTLAAARRAAGAVVEAVELVMQDRHQIAFCAVRPPGHHAERDKAMGFCLFNNIAVGAAHALQQWGVSKLAVIDFDAHFGNGTEQMFADNEQVMICSCFQHPFYPGCGQPSYDGHIINVPLAAGAGGAELKAGVEQHWLPALEKFEPELILISAGFDGHREDDMSELELVEEDYAWLSEQIKAVADRYAGGRIVSVLEGGYALSALGRSVVAHLKALLG